MTPSLKLIPFPKKISFTGNGFNWQAADRLMLAPESGPGDFDALTVLADEMEKAGIPRPLLDRKGMNQKRRRGLYLSYISGGKHGEEGYAIDILDNTVKIEAGTSSGIFYAVQTLRQIIQNCRGSWPGMRIEDAPVIPHRGLMISVSQGVAMKPQIIHSLVERLSAFKLNILQLYFEGMFKFASHPDVEPSIEGYTAEDILRLEKACSRYHVDFQPCFNSMGHLRRMLGNPKYSHLAESRAEWSLCPTDTRVYKLLGELFADFLPLFSSAFFNAGCDEVFDLGLGRSAGTAQRLGKARLFVNHVKAVRALAAKYGKRVMIWGDMLRNMPEALDILPHDIILLNWCYEDAGVSEQPWLFDTTKLFQHKGFEVWGSPCIGTHNTVFAKHLTAAKNIRDQVKAVIRHGGKGILNTAWPYPQIDGNTGCGFHGCVLGAGEAWSPGVLDEKQFDDAFSFHGLKDPSGKAMAAIRKIAEYTDESSEIRRSLLDDSFPALPRKGNVHLSKHYFDRMTLDIERAAVFLDRIGDPLLRRMYSSGARMSWLAARKGRLDSSYFKLGSTLSKKEIMKEAAKLAHDIQKGFKQYKRLWQFINKGEESSIKAIETRTDAVVRSLNPKFVEQKFPAMDNRISASDLTEVIIPQKSDGEKIITDFHRIPAFGISAAGKSSKVEFRLSYDSRCFHITCAGEEPAIERYRNNPRMLEAFSAIDFFEIFLAPHSTRPVCYGHFAVSGLGQILRKQGLPFEGVKCSSKIEGTGWVVKICMPWTAIGRAPKTGASWRGNFTYTRCHANMEALSWSPVKRGFNDPDNFGIIIFG